MGDRSLTQLCTICHINVPKYTCPRCAIQTCSLPCSKRHKSWSQCSGIRDPAAYVKRKDLANTAAFDKDFNFISGIERSLERADRDAENRGIALDDRAPTRKKRRTGEVGFFSRLEASRVDVIRAPTGMTRNLQNLSQWHKKHKCINWTLEWVFPDGQKTLTKCLAATTIGTAFSRTSYAKEHNLVQKKPMQTTPDTTVKPDEFDSKYFNIKESVESSDIAHTYNAQEEGRGQKRERSRTLSVEPLLEKPIPEQEPKKSETIESTNVPTIATPDIDPSVHIYLHRPRTLAKVPVLIPLSPSISLSEALTGRKVLEFPTLYVLLHSTDKPGDDKHMLEEDYVIEYGAEDTLAEGKNQQGVGVGADIMEAAQKLESVDETKIIEVLQKDLGAN